MKMKNIKSILSILYLGLMINACSSESEQAIPATEISNIRLQSNPGSIDLNWEFPEGNNTNRFIEIRYFDPGKQKNIRKTVNGTQTAIKIEDTRKKYGEYKFTVQPFSTSLTPGKGTDIKGASEAAPIVSSFTSKEIIPSINDISVSGNQPDGSFIIPSTASGSGIENAIDGKLDTRMNPNYAIAQTGAVFYIDVTYAKMQSYLQFSYNTATLGNYPIEIQCYVKANANDEWTLIKTLTTAQDGLPTTKDGALFKSKEYEAPFSFKYFRFKVPKTNSGAPNFSVAEFRIYDVTYYFNDPEA